MSMQNSSCSNVFQLAHGVVYQVTDRREHKEIYVRQCDFFINYELDLFSKYDNVIMPRCKFVSCLSLFTLIDCYRLMTSTLDGFLWRMSLYWSNLTRLALVFLIFSVVCSPSNPKWTTWFGSVSQPRSVEQLWLWDGTEVRILNKRTRSPIALFDVWWELFIGLNCCQSSTKVESPERTRRKSARARAWRKKNREEIEAKVILEKHGK